LHVAWPADAVGDTAAQPRHGEIARERGFSAIRTQQPLCPLRPAQGAGCVIDYTPDTGFAGADYLVFQEVTVDHQDKVFRISIVVK
jgi:hypothetical protein